jgi:hypothetical protein
MAGDPFATALRSTIVLDELDADRILRWLYNGHRPERVHTLICLCGEIADLRKSPAAWNGWRILPNAVCPECLASEDAKKVQEIAELYPSLAYEKFLKQLEKILLQKARNR